MSVTRLSENPVLTYFDTLLTKDEFISKCCAELKKNVMSHYPAQSDSPEAKKVAEQSWGHYLKVYDAFKNNQVTKGVVRFSSLTLQLEDLERVYFDALKDQCRLAPRHLYITDYIANNPEKFQRFSAQDRDKTRYTMNIPYYILKKPDSIFIDYFLPLIHALGSTRYLQTMALIQLGVDVNQYSPYNGNTPLLLAVSKGWNHQDPDSPESKSSNFYPQKEIIKALIEKKADVNAIHLRNGMTPLHIACLRGDDPELINLLLANGANIHAKDYQGRTPLELINFSYEDTKQTIQLLTLTSEDFGCESFVFGSRLLNLPENISSTATLPLKEERIANQAKIKAMLASAEMNLSQNPFGKFAPPSSENSTPCDVNGDKNTQNPATYRTLSC